MVVKWPPMLVHSSAELGGAAGEVTLVFTGMPETNCVFRKTGETLNLCKLQLARY